MSTPKTIKFNGQVYRLADVPEDMPAEMIGERKDVSELALRHMSNVHAKMERIRGHMAHDEGLPELDRWLGHLKDALFPRGRHSRATEEDLVKIDELAGVLGNALQSVNAATRLAKELTYKMGRESSSYDPYEASVKQADIYTPSWGDPVTPQTLMEAFPRDLDEAQAYQLAERASKPGRKDTFLNAVNQAIGGHGIEAEWGPDIHYGNPIALYVNTGDMYNATVLLDTDSGKLYVTTLGDWRSAREHAEYLSSEQAEDEGLPF